MRVRCKLPGLCTVFPNPLMEYLEGCNRHAHMREVMINMYSDANPCDHDGGEVVRDVLPSLAGKDTR